MNRDSYSTDELRRLIKELRAQAMNLADEGDWEGPGVGQPVKRIEWQAAVLLERGPQCPYVVTSDEGTSYCRLAAQSGPSQPVWEEDDRERRLFYMLDEHQLLTGAWVGMSYAD